MKKVRKAVIPAAGLGTRVLPATKVMPKEMLPIVDKPAIQYIVEEAVHAARENAVRNNLSNCEFLCGDVLQKVEELTGTADVIILDPPRAGIHPKAITKLLAFSPETFVYVSCKATSLINDLPAFLEAGYTIEKVCPVDMFPNTEHVETVALMTRTDVAKG